MPKRRNSEDCDYISRKIKKLERKLKRVRQRNREKNEESSRNSSGMYFTAYLQCFLIHKHPPCAPILHINPRFENTDTIELIEPYESPQPPESPDICVITSDMQTPENHTTDTQSKIQVPEEPAVQNNALDSDALDILGADPSSQIQYAKNVHTELASRLEHIATSGLTKELRKELNERYLIPGNCIMIGAPLMNPEIKAAVTDTVMKRDKGIEARQKQLAAAISGLAIVLHNELENKDKDTTLSKDTLKQLMDPGSSTQTTSSSPEPREHSSIDHGAGPAATIQPQSDARQLVEDIAASVQANPPPLDPQPEHTWESYPGCRSIVRKALLRRRIPPSAIDIMMASLASNSLKQYDVALKKWFLYCKHNCVNMYEASIPTVLHFLTESYNSGSQYGTLNSYRSALALILGPYMSKDDRISRFLKGVYRLRPPRPKYNETWDTSLVLNYLHNQYPNEQLALEVLTKKCITLLALSTAHRVQTLAKIRIENIEILSSQIRIKISDLIKTSRVSAKQPLLVLPFFTDKPEICPSKTLLSYLEVTKTIRKDSNLFISPKKVHNSVTSQSLSRWIKNTLKDSGIDTSIFTAHSTRHAATSKAYKCGVSVDFIRKTAGWSGSSTVFGRFYNRMITNNNNETALATAVLAGE
ncbi:hypothetical protein ABMA28_006351 [Loxostege sticticalis]|uniref:Tyr recombinase domain-containing protein n=1 Tax=Loxostege sticticalis TaxID=481309 RepID=A0ABD0SPW2_LOXSC